MTPGAAAEQLKELSAVASASDLTVAVAESLTSGTVASTVGAADGASEWFAGAVVAYQTDVKHRLLGVSADTDPCSASCAEQLAAGVRELLGADVAVSTTGVGGPDPSDGHPPGTVYLGWSTAAGSGHRFLALAGGPSEVLDAATREAVDLLVQTAHSL